MASWRMPGGTPLRRGRRPDALRFPG